MVQKAKSLIEDTNNLAQQPKLLMPVIYDTKGWENNYHQTESQLITLGGISLIKFSVQEIIIAL